MLHTQALDECCAAFCTCGHFSIKWYSVKWFHPLGIARPTISRTWQSLFICPLSEPNPNISPFTQLSLRMIPYPIFLTSIILMPFVYHNHSGYILFCTHTQPSISPPWCHTFPPSIYTHAQSQYWNVGFLRYWTLAQVPNFIIAAPSLVTLLLSSLYHLIGTLSFGLQLRSSQSLASSRTHSKHNSIPSTIFFHPALTPHAIHALFFSTAILLTSHIQIILRLTASMPFTYWAAAWLLVESPMRGRWWIAWSLLWSSLSVVLWGAGLPPA